MKMIIVGVILLAMALIVLMYKREGDIKKLLISLVMLISLVSLGIVGNVMRSVTPLFLTHLVALLIAYMGMMVYIVRGKIYWLLIISPIVTLILYIMLAWLGNEHLAG